MITCQNIFYLIEISHPLYNTASLIVNRLEKISDFLVSFKANCDLDEEAWKKVRFSIKVIDRY